MEKNKTGKPASRTGRYLKYAIGEIILVVIGILIALWINSSYNYYKEKKIEKIILKNLLIDIESDFEQLNKFDSLYDKHLKNLKKAKKAFFNNQNDSIAYYISKGYEGAGLLDFNPRTTTYDEMINSGKLYNLSNESITNSCIDYYEILENNTYQTRQLRIEYRNVTFGPQMNEFWLLYLEIDENKNNSSELIKSFVENKNSVAYKTLKQSSGWSVMIIERVKRSLSKLKEANRDLKNKLDSELKTLE